MTEKRLRYMRAFLVGSSEFVIDDNATHERLKKYDILDRLNELNDENEQLKSELSEKDIQLDFLKDENKHMRDLVNENEQLKSELGKLNILYKAKCKTEEQLIEMGKEVEKENEYLKQELNSFKKVIFKYLGGERVLYEKDGDVE